LTETIQTKLGCFSKKFSQHLNFHQIEVLTKTSELQM